MSWKLKYTRNEHKPKKNPEIQLRIEQLKHNLHAKRIRGKIVKAPEPKIGSLTKAH